MLASLIVALPQSPLDAILNDPKLDGVVCAATVTDIEGKVLYERNGGLRVVPASNQKLLSTAFALRQLGPLYRPETRIWRTSTRTVVDAPGDPLLSHNILVQARRRLRLDRQLPVHVREPYAPGVPPSWEVDDLPNKYAAPITAFTVDRGSFELWRVLGKPVLRPEPYGVKIEREVTSGATTRITYDPFLRRVKVSGQLPAEGEARLDTLALPRPDEAAAMVLGGKFVPTDDLPLRAPDLIILGSSMADMIKACLPPSDNNIAEHLLLIGARSSQPFSEDPYTDARERLTNFLVKDVGVRKEDFRVYDGSGMSRHNLVTVRGMARLMVWQNQQPTAGVWRSALAKPGIGTLNGRLQGVLFEGKTGTLDMVVSLTGYVRTPLGQDRVVSIILNHFVGPSGDARGIVDSFVKASASL